MRSILSLFHILAISSCLYAYEVEIGGIYYGFIGRGKAYVTHGGLTAHAESHYTGKVVVPEEITYDGRTYTVVSVDENAFAGCEDLTSVEFPSGVLAVSPCAFLGCTGLTSVILPRGIMSLGSCAFTGCTSLEQITLPRHAALVDSLTLYCCASLTSLVLPHRIRIICGGALRHLPKLKDLYCYASEPPLTEAEAFCEGDQQHCTLHVPRESMKAYRQSPVWNRFHKIVALTEENYTEQGYRRGDVNDDGITDDRDIVLLRRIILGLPDETSVRWAADINADGIVNAVDYVLLVTSML